MKLFSSSKARFRPRLTESSATATWAWMNSRAVRTWEASLSIVVGRIIGCDERISEGVEGESVGCAASGVAF